MLKSYYDKKNNRIVQIGNISNSSFWDNHWKTNPVLAYSQKYSFIIPIIRKFLKKGRILEAGCGPGDKVYLLQEAGYDAVGIDYAKETVEAVKNSMPSLDIRIGDVRNLPFEDECFDGYLSLGVIEHLYEGYDLVIKEMRRVLKKNGFAFVGFPFLCPLRKIKLRRNCYPLWEEKVDLVNNFYQFILDYKKVLEDFQKNGFAGIKLEFFDGVKCIKDEINSFRPILQKIYDSRNIYIKMAKFGINKISSCFAAHLALLVIKKH